MSSLRGDYISSVSQFSSDSLTSRLEYERSFLEHRARLAAAHAQPPRRRATTAAATVDSWNSAVFDPESGLRARLAHNHTVNPLRDQRAEEVARSNAALVSRLRAIAFSKPGSGNQAVRERSVRGAALTGAAAQRARMGAGGFERLRAQELARIEADNLSIAARLLNNHSELAANSHTFAKHVARHNYLLGIKSRARAIRMKSSTPGQTGSVLRSATVKGSRGGGRREEQQQQDDEEDSNQPADLSPQHQQIHEYEYAMAAYNAFIHAQQAQGQQFDGPLPPTSFLPPIVPQHPPPPATTPASSSLPSIPGFEVPSDAELLQSAPQPWLESHQDDQLLAQRSMSSELAHVPRTRQSFKEHPREALRAPLRKHYHRAHHAEDVARRREVARAFEQLESTLLVPRTRLDARTGSYELEWTELHEGGRGHSAPTAQQQQQQSEYAAQQAQYEAAALAQAQQDAMAQYQYQQHMASLYASFIEQQQQAQQALQEQETAQQNVLDEAMAAAAHSNEEAKEEAAAFDTSPTAHTAAAASAAAAAAAPSVPGAPAVGTDGLPYAEPVWPFGGSIVPPHLRPVPQPPQMPVAALQPAFVPMPPFNMPMPVPPVPPAQPMSPSQQRSSARGAAGGRRSKHVAAAAAATAAAAAAAKRGRQGKQIFPLRVKPGKAGAPLIPKASGHSSSSSALPTHEPAQDEDEDGDASLRPPEDDDDMGEAEGQQHEQWLSHEQHEQAVQQMTARLQQRDTQVQAAAHAGPSDAGASVAAAAAEDDVDDAAADVDSGTAGHSSATSVPTIASALGQPTTSDASIGEAEEVKEAANSNSNDSGSSSRTKLAPEEEDAKEAKEEDESAPSTGRSAPPSPKKDADAVDTDLASAAEEIEETPDAAAAVADDELPSDAQQSVALSAVASSSSSSSSSTDSSAPLLHSSASLPSVQPAAAAAVALPQEEEEVEEADGAVGEEKKSEGDVEGSGAAATPTEPLAEDIASDAAPVSAPLSKQTSAAALEPVSDDTAESTSSSTEHADTPSATPEQVTASASLASLSVAASIPLPPSASPSTHSLLPHASPSVTHTGSEDADAAVTTDDTNAAVPTDDDTSVGVPAVGAAVSHSDLHSDDHTNAAASSEKIEDANTHSQAEVAHAAEAETEEKTATTALTPAAPASDSPPTATTTTDSPAASTPAADPAPAPVAASVSTAPPAAASDDDDASFDLPADADLDLDL